MHLAAAPGDNDIGPPVMGYHGSIHGRFSQQLTRSLIEYHGIATTNTLRQGIGERRLPAEQLGHSEILIVWPHQYGTTAIDRWYMPRHGLQPLQGPLQLGGTPYIILIRPGVEVGLTLGMAGHRHEVLCKTSGRAGEELDTIG